MSRLWSVRLVGATFASLSTFVILESIRDRSKCRHFLPLNDAMLTITYHLMKPLTHSPTYSLTHVNYYLIGSIPSLSVRQQEEAITTTIVYRQKLQEMIQEANDPTNSLSSIVQTTATDVATLMVDLFQYLKKSTFK